MKMHAHAVERYFTHVNDINHVHGTLLEYNNLQCTNPNLILRLSGIIYSEYNNFTHVCTRLSGIIYSEYNNFTHVCTGITQIVRNKKIRNVQNMESY